MSGMYSDSIQDQQHTDTGPTIDLPIDLADDKVYTTYASHNGPHSIRLTIPKPICEDVGVTDGDLIKHKQVAEDRWIVEVVRA